MMSVKNNSKPQSSLHLILFSVLLLIAWLLPNHYLPWTTFYQEFLSAAALLSIAFVVFATNKKIHVPWLSILIIAISIIPLIQWQANIIPFVGDAIMSSFYIFGLAGAIAVGYNLRNHQFDILITLAIIFVSGGVISSFFAIYQWLELSGIGLDLYIAEVPNNIRPYANFAQPNNLATFIMCSLISLVYLWEKDRVSSTLTLVISQVLLIGLALPQSRTTWAIALILGIWWLLKKNKLSLKLTLLPSLITACIYISFIHLKPIIENLLLISSQTRIMSAELGLRSYIWTTLLDAVLNGPGWGFGWQPVANAQISVAHNHPVGILAHQSHNLLLDLLIWNGLWLGGLLILISTWWFIHKIFAIKSKASFYAFSIILAMTTHAMLEFPLHYAFFLLPFGLLIGYIEHEYNFTTFQSFRIPRSITLSTTFLSFILLVIIFREYIIIEKDLRLVRYESARIGNIKVERPGSGVVLLTQLRDSLRFSGTEATPDLTPEDLQHMELIAHRFGYPAWLMRYSLALGLNKEYEQASSELQLIRKLHGEELYQEAKDNWAILTERYPELSVVTLP